jgi:competence protein ComEA
MKEWLDRYRGFLFFLLIVLVLAGVVVLQALRSEPPGVILTSPTPPPSEQVTSTPRPLRVYVSGAVQHPDVYSLPADSIVKNALAAAGGAADDADLDRINLAMPVADGQHIYVPRRGEQQLPMDSPRGPSPTEDKININTANPAELETLPGIGPTIAQRICEYREAHGTFTRIEDIMQVSGIGQATFAKIQDLITTD